MPIRDRSLTATLPSVVPTPGASTPSRERRVGIPKRHASPMVSTDHVDDEDLTEVQIDELFERTQPIGNAINALAQAELTVVTVVEAPPDYQDRLG